MMIYITEYLDEQKRLAEAATEGPWENYSPNPRITPEQAIYSKWLDAIPEARSSEIAALLTPKDAAFVAAARSSVPRMIAALEAVTAMHRPVRSVHGETVCAHRYCVDEQLDQTPWPCPTIRAVEAALGGERDE